MALGALGLQYDLLDLEALVAQWVHGGPLLLCQLGQEDLELLYRL